MHDGVVVVKPRAQADPSWLPRRPRFQQRHAGRRPVYEERVVGTDSPDRKRLPCGFRDAAGKPSCAAPDLGAVTAWGGITLAPGMLEISGVWRLVLAAVRPDDAPWDGLGTTPQIGATDLPLIAQCRDGHLTRITAGVLACVRMLRPMT